MGKSEILMLLAGVALSVMLAMVAVPMFSSGNDMANRTQVQQDLMSIKSAIPLVLALEGDEVGKFNPENMAKHVTGINEAANNSDDDGGTFKSKLTDVTYTIDDSDPTRSNIIVTIQADHDKFNLSKLTRLESICDGTGGVESLQDDGFTCNIKR